MRLSFSLFYKLRLLGALLTFILAALYLAGAEKIAISGFAILACLVTVVCTRLRKGTMSASCDLCGTSGSMKAEYGAGFSNARLVLECPRCGRVVNGEDYRAAPRKE